MTDYDKIQALNWSSLRHLATSPLLYRYRQDHPEPRKKSYVIGNAIHTAVLEPEKFAERYAVFDGTRRGPAWKEWLAKHPGKESLKPPELAAVEAAAKAVSDHRVAADIFRGGRREEVLTWTGPGGLLCKGRVDYIRPDVVADLKSVGRDVSPRKFGRDAAEYLYHGQLAWYHDGAIAAGKIPANAPPPLIVAVQSKPPFDVAVYQLSYEDLDLGRSLYAGLVQTLQECIAADYWPGCAPDLEQLTLPPWTPGVDATEEIGDFA